MRNKRTIRICACLIVTALMTFMFSFSVFATSVVEEATENFVETEVVEDVTQAVTEIPQETSAPTQAQDNENEEPQYNDNVSDNGVSNIEDEDTDDFWGFDEEEETQPQTYYEVYGDELPQVESQDVTEPTTVEIPEVEVTDTSLIGGVIAWLCVAVGIAVIAGVLVSQRTRQTNSNSQNQTKRRR